MTHPFKYRVYDLRTYKPLIHSAYQTFGADDERWDWDNVAAPVAIIFRDEEDYVQFTLMHGVQEVPPQPDMYVSASGHLSVAMSSLQAQLQALPQPNWKQLTNVSMQQVQNQLSQANQTSLNQGINNINGGKI